jgi:hypothetical protein
MFDKRLALPENWVMTIALARDVEDFLKEQVRDGACADPGELANNLLRSLRERQDRTFKVTPELESWLLESADQPATPLTGADFQAIRGGGSRKVSKRR